MVSSWLRGRVLDWRLSQQGFNSNYGNLVCLATLMSSDKTKQICLWMLIYIYIYIYTQVGLKYKDTCCLYKFIWIISSFLDMIFGFRLELVDEFTEIVPVSHQPFVGHHQGFCQCIEYFVLFLVFKFMELQKTLTYSWIKLRFFWYLRDLKQNAINGNRIIYQEK